MELDGCVHAGVAFVVDGVVSIGTDVADGNGCFVGRVVEILGESCIRVDTPAWQREARKAERGGRRRARPASSMREMAREPGTVTYDCRKDLVVALGKSGAESLKSKLGGADRHGNNTKPEVNT